MMYENKKSTSPLKAFSVGDYLQKQFKADAREYAENSKIKTGYDNLDAKNSLHPGLYVIGALPSLGKTTFSYQMADQISAQGYHVIYISYEQTTLDLVSKSLSRNMGMTHPSTAMTANQIKMYSDDPRVDSSMRKYLPTASNLTIVEAPFDSTMTDLIRYIENYMDEYKVKPVIVVDYLQVIFNGYKNYISAKDTVDANVKRLKKIQADNQLVVLIISSFNRSNYLTQVDYESFKETGGIEYTADVVWGMQLKVLNDAAFDNLSLNDKRKKIKEAKAEIPRKIEIVCLKNRFGPATYSVFFDYFPQFDYFRCDTPLFDL